MTREKYAFVLVLMISQRLISYIILAQRKSLLVMILFFIKNELGLGTRVVLKNLFQ